jgi:predicted DNA-binding transcriptional regulator AlpA
MENKGCIREGYKGNQKSHNETGPAKAQVLFENLIWGVDEVCSVSGYAKGTIYNLVSRGEIPYRKRGRRKCLVFVPSEVIAWLRGEKT